MAFIGESRKNGRDSQWKLYVCLDVEDCEMILEAISKVVARKLKTYEYYLDIHESGEATEKQQTKLVKAEDDLNKIIGIRDDVVKYIKLKNKK